MGDSPCGLSGACRTGLALRGRGCASTGRGGAAAAVARGRRIAALWIVAALFVMHAIGKHCSRQLKKPRPAA